MIDFQKLLDFEIYSGVSADEIIKVEIEMDLALPSEYKQLLQYTNGFVTEEGITIFGIDIINERNKTYEVGEYAEGYVAIGSNGGGKFLLMASNEDSTELIQVDSGVMNPEYATVVSESFVKWINDGAVNVDLIDESQEIHNEKLCDLILVRPPVSGALDLKKIQEVFNIKKGLFDLLKGSKQLPFVLKQDIPLELARKNIEQLGKLGEILETSRAN